MSSLSAVRFLTSGGSTFLRRWRLVVLIAASRSVDVVGSFEVQGQVMFPWFVGRWQLRPVGRAR